MRFARGQSTTEQLITYGWAIGIIVVLLGVLAYSGAVNAFGNVEERCVFQNGFYCDKSRFYSLAGKTTLEIEMTNLLARNVQVTGVLCSAEQINPAIGYPERGFEDVSSLGIEMQSDGVYSFVLTCYGPDGKNSANVGGTFNGLVYFKYRELDGSSSRSPSGDHMKMANVVGRVN